MTGYGKADSQLRGKKLICEIRSLNSKSMDISVRLVSQLRAHELDLRTMLTQRLERGKVDLLLMNDGMSETSSLNDVTPINWLAAKEYARQYEEQFGVSEVPSEVMAAILRFSLSKGRLSR